MGGEIFVGYEDGRSDAYNEYGQRPWQPGYSDEKRSNRETNTLARFQAEFAVLQGKEWRGWSNSWGNEGPRSDSDDYHEYIIKRGTKDR